MRDRLIEILKKFCTDDCKITHNCGYCDFGDLTVCPSAVAEHLLTNGVIVPPCKVGDKVYFIGHVGDGIPDFIYDDTITKIGVITRGICHEKGIDFADIGKTVFLTREEAEQVLKGECHAEIH